MPPEADAPQAVPDPDRGTSPDRELRSAARAVSASHCVLTAIGYGLRPSRDCAALLDCQGFGRQVTGGTLRALLDDCTAPARSASEPLRVNAECRAARERMPGDLCGAGVVRSARHRARRFGFMQGHETVPSAFGRRLGA
jgi:hypothetical protein